LKIIHLSDLHIGKSNNLEKSTSIVDWILQNKELHGSSTVVISGDLVDDGQKWQFIQAKELIDRLRIEEYVVLIAPGNHDYGPDGYRESRQSRVDFKELITDVESYPHVYSEGDQAFIILDSMAEEFLTIEVWGAQGNLGIDQLNKLDLILDELADNPVVERILVVLHHHPFDYLFYHGLRDHADLKGVISKRMGKPPRVNVVLFGHKHLEHRFNDPDENKEELFGIDMIYASGQTVERKSNGKMIVPVIDLPEYNIQRFEIN
jgi:3',5'-cyclic AMP phosphodiesterase CpdA